MGDKLIRVNEFFCNKKILESQYESVKAIETFVDTYGTMDFSEDILQTFSLGYRQKHKIPAWKKFGLIYTQAEILHLDINHVGVDEEGYVTKIDVGYGLQGVLPEKLKELTRLNYLDISQNNLSEIPDWIFDFEYLENLVVSHNKIKTIPNKIENLTNLKELNLYENKIREFPLSIINLAGLERLRMGKNPITHLPIEITQLTNLQYIEFFNCPIEPINGKKVNIFFSKISKKGYRIEDLFEILQEQNS